MCVCANAGLNDVPFPVLCPSFAFELLHPDWTRKPAGNSEVVCTRDATVTVVWQRLQISTAAVKKSV